MRTNPRLAALFLILTAGCSLTAFDVSQEIPAQTIPGDPTGGQLPPIQDQSLDLNAQIQAQSTGPLGTVRLKSLTLTITAPEGGTWEFVESMDIYIASVRESTTLPPAKIATVSNPGAVNTMSFTAVGVDLAGYINEGAKLSATASGTAPPQDTTYTGRALFTINPLN